MKKCWRCFICRTPTEMRVSVCAKAQRNTLLLVSSLVARNFSSRSCAGEKRAGWAPAAWAGGAALWAFEVLSGPQLASYTQVPSGFLSQAWC